MSLNPRLIRIVENVAKFDDATRVIVPETVRVLPTSSGYKLLRKGTNRTAEVSSRCVRSKLDAALTHVAYDPMVPSDEKNSQRDCEPTTA